MIKKYFASVVIFFSLIETAFTHPSSAEMMRSVSEIGTPQASLPECVNVAADIATIQNVQRANAKTSQKYDGYRKVLAGDTDTELATRLVYAEALAANCSEQNDRIVDLVAAVIGNRIRIRGGEVESVVFQRDQFASSLNIYSESRYRDFLCPDNRELWEKALGAMRAHLGESKSSLAESKRGAPLPKDAVHYYLYRHSDRFTPPAWKLDEVSSGGEQTRGCIRVFRNPAWK